MTFRYHTAFCRAEVADRLTQTVKEESWDRAMDRKEEGEELCDGAKEKHKRENKKDWRMKEVAPHGWGQQVIKVSEGGSLEPRLLPPWRHLASFVVLLVVT